MLKFLLISIVLNTNIQTKPVGVFDTLGECQSAQAIYPKIAKLPKDKVVYVSCVELK